MYKLLQYDENHQNTLERPGSGSGGGQQHQNSSPHQTDSAFKKSNLNVSKYNSYKYI